MRLVFSDAGGNLRFQEFVGKNTPPYGILSHRWLPYDEEPTFNEFINGKASAKPGYKKLLFCRDQAALDGLDFFWSDTICIDKADSVALSEDINSMFRYYKEATKCYVYLSDVVLPSSQEETDQSIEPVWMTAFKTSQWFTRGWTLQELIAPSHVKFYSADMQLLGDKLSLIRQISQTTRIPCDALRGERLSRFTVDERMAWALERRTTKEEDLAYSLIGIFGVSLPLIYGEGRESAMYRLRREVKERFPEEHLHEHLIQPSVAGLPFSTVPDYFRRDANFVAREDVLDDIDRKFEVGRSQRVALVGLGGIGKSQIAIEYGHRLHARDPSQWIFWIHGGTIARLQESFQALAERLQLKVASNRASKSTDMRVESESGHNAEAYDTQYDTLKAVHRWLTDPGNGHWTMIVDNVDDASILFQTSNIPTGMSSPVNLNAGSSLAKYLPSSVHGRILFTTRNENLAARLTESENDIINIGPMSEAESLNLFRTKRKCFPQSTETDDDIAELLELLECIPLAITQATAYLNRSRSRTIPQYLHAYNLNRDSRGSLLKFDGGDRRRNEDMHNSILLTWQVSFEQIAKERKSAADLLSLMSFFHFQDIPMYLLRCYFSRAWKVFVGTDDFDVNFDEDVVYLHGYSLIKSSENGHYFNMHRLVQFAMQLWLEGKEQKWKWQAIFQDDLQQHMPSPDVKNLPTYRTLFPHIQAMSAELPGPVALRLQWTNLLSHCALYASALGSFITGEEMSRKAYQVRVDEMGKDNPYTLSALTQVGKSLLNQCRYTEAEEVLERALNNRTYTSDMDPAESRDIGDIILSLGTIYCNLGRMEEAEKLCRDTLTGWGKVSDQVHPVRNELYALMSTALKFQRRYDAAEKVALQVLNWEVQSNGEFTSEALDAKSQLGVIYRLQERLDDAEKIATQVLGSWREVYGESHRHSTHAEAELARIYYLQGRLDDAEQLGRTILDGSTAVLGKDHPITLLYIMNLALTLQKAKRFEESIDLFHGCMDGQARVLGEEHKDTLRTMGHLIDALAAVERFEEAANLQRPYLQARIKELGEFSLDLERPRDHFIQCLKKSGNMDEAISTMQDDFDRRVAILGTSDDQTMIAFHRLRRSLEDLDRWDEVVKIATKHLATCISTLGPTHPTALYMMRLLASTLRVAKHFDKARPIMRRYLALQLRITGIRDPETRGDMAYNARFEALEQAIFRRRDHTELSLCYVPGFRANPSVGFCFAPAVQVLWNLGLEDTVLARKPPVEMEHLAEGEID